MDYSVLNKKFFYIKKNSTLPEIKYPLIQQIREKYDITEDMLRNVAVTFSMIEEGTGIYYIANAPANLVINKDRTNYPDENDYTLTYRFKPKETKKCGVFLGEFKLDFLGYGNCGKLTLPINDYIRIFISDSITKTTIIKQ